jgi:cellulose synthase (UDP-forming)
VEAHATNVSAVVPACGEPAEVWGYLERLCAYLGTHADRCQVIVVDDGSAPAAVEAASEFARRNVGVLVLRTGAPGIEDAVRAGVLQASGELVLVVGPDLCTPPEDFEQLIGDDSDAELILGSREAAPSPGARRCRRMLRGHARALGLRGIEDPAAGFRLMRRDVARDVYPRVRSRGRAGDLEAVLIAEARGYGVVEVSLPRQEPERQSERGPGGALRLRQDLAGLRSGLLDGAEDADLAPARRLARARRRTLRALIVADLGALAWWLTWLFDFRHAAIGPLYAVLVAAQLINVFQVVGYWHAVWRTRPPRRRAGRVPGSVDVFVTVYNEPLEVIEPTIAAAAAMPHPHRTLVLDDGNRPQVGVLARRHGAVWVTRPDNRGAKAGNINHALTTSSRADFFCVFDADHVPRPEFLDRMMPWFRDQRVAFVQSPQYYGNRDSSYVAGGAMDQQDIFFGPICEGADGSDSVICCGTNFVMRRAALDEVGGFREDSVTEDALTGLDLHARGWRSRYVPERLAVGLAPEDLGAYVSQQSRWARGNLELLFRHSPLLRKGLPLELRFRYAWAASHYLSGLSNLVYLVLPCLYLFTGIETVTATASDDFIAHFLPYIFLTVFIFTRSCEGRLRFRAIQFNYGLLPVYLEALFSAVTGKRARFVVTPKTASTESFYNLVAPQLALVTITLSAIGAGLVDYQGPSTITNVCWALFNIAMLSALIRAARAVPQGASGAAAPVSEEVA